jgi:hypothetical protein
MLAIAITRRMSLDGRWAYTLYQRPKGAPFVHVLDTVRRTAACVDVPELQGTDLEGMRLTLSHGGASLRVEDDFGPRALIDTRTFAVSAPAPTPPATTPGPRHDAGGGGLPWLPVGIGTATLAALAGIVRRRGRVRSAAA